MPTPAATAEVREPLIPAPLAAAAASDAQQAVRMRRFAMASATYLAGIPLMLLAHGLGFVALGPTLATIAAVIAVNVSIYVLFRTRQNLRFADPSLTWLQIVLATATVMGGAFVLETLVRTPILCPVLLMYGMFRFTTRQFIVASGFVLACYAAVIAASAHQAGDRDSAEGDVPAGGARLRAALLRSRRRQGQRDARAFAAATRT